MISLSDINTDQRLDSVTMMPDYCVQEIFSCDINNESCAKILVVLSEQSREIILSNLNTVRKDKISELLELYLSEKTPLTPQEVEISCESLLDRIEYLVKAGFIRISTRNEIDESFLDMSAELINFSDSLPIFDFNHNDLHDLIIWWNLAAKNSKTILGKRYEVQNIILERLDDQFSTELYSTSIDDATEQELHQKSNLLRAEALEDYKIRVNLIESFILSTAQKLSVQQLASELSSFFSDKKAMEERLLKHGPLLLYPAIKERLPAQDIAMSLYKLGLIIADEGLDEMDKYTKKFDDQFFRKGAALLLAGIDEINLGKIITERKKAYTWELETKMKMITDAVICIRNNVSTYVMLELMSSYTVYDFEE
ncbi:MAG: hypothetical protein BA863_11445 [Desulfovibrio sp. S3730MH75]|nr:MAG: hypothetical protein BA863_11445 [Desulfovibrio sp. S3730MH75]